jgi:hypothetical protein
MVGKEASARRGAGRARGRRRREERSIEGTADCRERAAGYDVGENTSQLEPLIDLREDLVKLDWWREDDDMTGFTTEGYYRD